MAGRFAVDISGLHTRRGEVGRPACRHGDHLAHQGFGDMKLEPKLGAIRPGVVDGGVGHVNPHAHLLVVQRLA